MCFVAFRAAIGAQVYDFSAQWTEGVDIPAFGVGDRIVLVGPEATSFALEIVSAPPPGIAGQSFVATDAATGVGAIVKPMADGLRVTVDDFRQNKIYSFRIKDGVTTCTVREKSIEPDECVTCNGPAGSSGLNGPNALNGLKAPKALNGPSVAKGLKAPNGAEFPVAAQRAVVDVLVAFDQGAKAWAENAANWGGGDSIEEFADYAVNKMNMVLENSQLLDKFCYRLAGIVEVDATYASVGDPLLYQLWTGEGALSVVSKMREKCGADTTTLLIDRTGGTTTGVGYVYTEGNSSVFAEEKLNCNVCDIKMVYERYTMSHETGHNMGSGHSDRQGDGSGGRYYPYSYGYHFQDAGGTKRNTVMAYTYTSPASGTYTPVPYFSSPDVTPEDLGVAVGTPTNDNRRTLIQTCEAVSDFVEHVKPYDWDVRFMDGDGNDIPDGSFFTGTLYVTLTNANPDATIYYTKDGSTPNTGSLSCANGDRLTILDTTTITACAVTNGVAISFRKIAVNEGAVWSGEAGQRGNGRWIVDSSVLAWEDSTKPFNYGSYPSVCFADLAGISSATVTVEGTVAPYSASFTATDTSYVFAKGGNDSSISLGDASFAPAGNLAFDVPVSLAATSFTTPAHFTVAFNAPFGQTIDATSGHCTNQVVVGDSGTLVVAPGAGRTQTFGSFNNTGNYYNTATLQIGEGTVVFNGPINGNKGLFGSTKIAVGDGGNLVFNAGGATGYGVSSTLTVSKGGMVTFNDMEHMNRRLILDGGTVCCKRLDWMNGTTISATDDSSIVANGSVGYVLIRFADATVDVSAGTTLTLDVPITTGGNTANYGFVKTGGGELLANREMSHAGATVISNGTVSIGYSSTARVGLGWSVASDATLKLKDGCSLTVPMLTLESGATLALPATNAAPLSATSNVSVAGVTVELSNATNLSEGASYPLLASAGGISGMADVDESRLPALASGLEWQMAVVNDTLYAKVVAGVVQFVVARGETVNLSDIPATATSVIGEGTVCCGATLPDASLGWTNADWKGTLVFEGLVAGSATQNFQFELYGNANSKILLRNCGISYLKDNNATFSGTLALEQDNDGHVALTTVDGYSGRYNVFGALEGNGAMSFATGQRQGYVFETATNYSGSISIGAQNNSGILGGRYIVFGRVASANDFPASTNSASITVKPGATASIGGGATWYAYHGVDVGGTLLVKGANATLDCHVSATMGLKLDDGATLRFDSADARLTFGKAPRFASGTAHVAFAPGVAPQGGAALVAWPTNAVPEGAFAFADPSQAAAWDLCKTSTGLVVRPKNRFDIPGVEGAYLVEGDSLSAWLDDNNFELYALSGGTWQEFLSATGANGYANWMNFALGLSVEDANDTFKVAIGREGGKIVVSPLKPVYDGLLFTTTLYGAEALSSSLPAIDVFDGVVIELDPFAGSNAGFYKVGISVKGQGPKK